MLRKCVVFYLAVSSQKLNLEFDNVSKIDNLTDFIIKRDLQPVIHKRESFDLNAAKKRVKSFVQELLVLNPRERDFLKCFVEKEYRPEFLFEDEEIVKSLRQHPMALWKMMN